MSLPESTEILIVGAGPTGLCLALSLHKQGFTDFVVVDSLLPGDNGSRALAVHAATVEVRTSNLFHRLLCAICCTDMFRRATQRSQVYAGVPHGVYTSHVFQQVPAATRSVLPNTLWHMFRVLVTRSSDRGCLWWINIMRCVARYVSAAARVAGSRLANRPYTLTTICGCCLCGQRRVYWLDL